MGTQQNIRISPIRSYYNENDKENSDYEQILPISVFDAIHESMDPGSSTLTQIKQSIDIKINSLNAGKQNLLQPGTSGNIAIFTGEEGVLGSIPKTNTISTTTPSTNKIVTEKAIADFYTGIIQPEINNPGDLGNRVTELESDVETIQGDINTISNQLPDIVNSIGSKADQSELNDVRLIAEGKLDASSVSDIRDDLTQAKIDINNRVIRNNDIAAGSGTKIIYDEKGLITNSTNLVESDIPNISISKVNGLQDALDAAGSDKVIELEGKINNKLDKNQPIAAGSGAKITYDEKGLVTGKSNLIESDIPEISIGKVSGLQDALDNISSVDLTEIQQAIANKVDKNDSIIGGTKTKITYDEKGLVQSGSDLTINDLPAIPISKITGLQDSLNEIDSKVPEGGNIGDVLIMTENGLEWKSLKQLVKDIEDGEITPEATPVGTIDYINEIIDNLDNTNHTINDEVYSVNNNKVSIEASWLGTTISIIKNSTGASKADSEAQLLTLPNRVAAPNVTSEANSGSITGVDNTMEYRILNGVWISISGTEITGLMAGNYEVRVKAIAGVSFAGQVKSINVTEGEGWTLTYLYPKANAVITSSNGRIQLSEWTGYSGQELNENVLYDASLTSMDDIKVRLFAKFATDSDFVEVLFDNFGNGDGKPNHIQRWGYEGIGNGYIQLTGSNSTGVDIQLRLVKEV